MPDGSVVAVMRYPVKSMMGEELNRCDVTEAGLLGDRCLALIDVETGMVVSAKNPRKWPGMFDFHAAFVSPPELGTPLPAVRVTLPDGRTMTTTSTGFADTVSSVLGRCVTLATVPLPRPTLEEYWPDLPEIAHQDAVTDEATLSGTFFDAASVHVLTTATINQLRDLTPSARFEPRRFRPNIVIRPEDDDIGFVENKWVGQRLKVGDSLVLTITNHCPRCVMTTLPQGDLPKDNDILRTAARHNDAQVGVYAEVSSPGMVRRGDSVLLC